MSRRGTLTPETGLGTKDGWSSSGKLTTGNGQQPVTMQADFPEADVYTVQFAVDPPTAGVYRATAQISWTVEGNTITRLVDVANGVAVSAPSQAVRVIINDATPSDAGATLNQSYGITVSATRGTRPNTGQPPTYLAFPIQVQIGPSANLQFQIPQGAGAISLEVAAASTLATASPDLLIEQQNASAVVLKSYRYLDQGVGVGFVPLSALATEIELSNLDGVNAVNVSACFGIEG